MKKTPLKKLSDKKQAQILNEIPIRTVLAHRCGGKYVQHSKLGGYCSGGYCEECGRKGADSYYPLFNLHPHEATYRSHCGKLSLENSKMLCTWCHGKKGH